MDNSLTEAKRREIVMELINGTFNCRDDLMAQAVASWAYTLGGLSDDTILRLWSDFDAVQ